MSVELKEDIFIPRDKKLISIWEAHERAHWLKTDALMGKDVEQWKSGKINDRQKAFIKMILRGFTQGDKNVCDGYVEKLLKIYKSNEARMMLLSFACRETTHVHAYKLLNDTLGYDTEDFMKEFLEYKEMADAHEFMIENVDLSTPRGRIEYTAKQVLMEGVWVFASFAMLLSFNEGGLLPGMVSVNKWSQVDESWHVLGLVELFKQHVKENPSVIDNSFKANIYETARTLVKLADAFIDLCFSVGEGYVTADQMKGYVRFVCDYRMQQLGFKEQFGIKENPVEWMDRVAGNTFGNFFEVTITEYSKSNLTGKWVYP